jgi:hypothetical protein
MITGDVAEDLLPKALDPAHGMDFRLASSPPASGLLLRRFQGRLARSAIIR